MPNNCELPTLPTYWKIPYLLLGCCKIFSWDGWMRAVGELEPPLPRSGSGPNLNSSLFYSGCSLSTLHPLTSHFYDRAAPMSMLCQLDWDLSFMMLPWNMFALQPSMFWLVDNITLFKYESSYWLHNSNSKVHTDRAQGPPIGAEGAELGNNHSLWHLIAKLDYIS